MGRVDGKVVMITGGAGAQGWAEAQRLVGEGASVLITDVNAVTGRELAARVERCEFVEHDVSSEDSWRAAVAACRSHFGRIDALVHNAAIFRPSSIADSSVEDYVATIMVNQVGTFIGLKVVAEAMAGGGSIVLISSVAGLMGTPGVIAYSSSKFAVRGMAKVAALELAAAGIRVNSVHPGAVDTPMIASVHERPGGMAAVVQNIPLGRLATADDVSSMVLFLVSDESSYCTGAEFVVDGGMTTGQHRGAPAPIRE